MPRAGRRSIVFVDMAVSLRKSPKVLPKLERVSQLRAIVSLLNAVFCLTVPPHSERSGERSFRHTNITSRRRARSLMVISPGDYGRGKGNTIRGIPENIVR